MVAAIWVVMRSCTWSRRAKTSTRRAILLMPTIRSRGMYATCAWPKNGRMWCSQSEKKSMSRTTIISEYGSVKSAPLMTLAGSCSYPWVK